MLSCCCIAFFVPLFLYNKREKSKQMGMLYVGGAGSVESLSDHSAAGGSKKVLSAGGKKNFEVLVDDPLCEMAQTNCSSSPRTAGGGTPGGGADMPGYAGQLLASKGINKGSGKRTTVAGTPPGGSNRNLLAGTPPKRAGSVAAYCGGGTIVASPRDGAGGVLSNAL